MKKTDINQYAGGPNPEDNGGGAQTARSVGKLVWKIVLSFLVVFGIVFITIGIFLFSYIMSLKNESVDVDLHSLKLNYTSIIYRMNDAGDPVEYQKLYNGEGDRIWVDFENIPQNMKNAMIAIEDKRFEEHNGVDWFRTIGATTTLFTKGGSYGGSTLTQQLIKNLTGDNDVSITRKVKEIFRAINLEKKYSKDEILEAYLNVVNYGAGTKGVQAAANLYFGKDINECDLAECAAIAGITQNPYKYNPLQFPEENKKRQQTVLAAMLEQEKVTQSEYDQAMKKSEHMTFVGKKQENTAENKDSVFNWYVDTMVEDVIRDLQTAYNCGEDEAANMLYYNGLKIYCAIDPEAQTTAEKIFANSTQLDSDPALQAGYFMMDYDGRVLAVVGSTAEKTSNRLFNNATDAKRQNGSTMKPISAYATAMEKGLINYSTLLSNEKLPDYFGKGQPGPNNYTKSFVGGMYTVKYCLQQSLNIPAAQLCNTLTPQACYEFLTQKMGFTNLNPTTDGQSISAMALGGVNGGVTLREVTAAYQTFGNGGVYNKPYTYYYVEDHDGKVILDNRNQSSIQAMKESTAGVMQMLLRNVMQAGTGTMANISGWQVYGKTGTTDTNNDSLFVGGTPYAVAGVWTGYSNPSSIKSKSVNTAKILWRQIMANYLNDKTVKTFDMGDSIVSATYCEDSGLLATDNCPKKSTGWYPKGDLPGYCTIAHAPIATPNSEPSESQTSEDPNASTPESGVSQPPSTSDTSSAPDTSASSGNTSSAPSSSKPASSASPDTNSATNQGTNPEPAGDGGAAA